MIKEISIIPINIYQMIISPILVNVFGQACRFEETCSEYAKRMIQEKGLVMGAKLSLVRLSKCQPFSV